MESEVANLLALSDGLNGLRNDDILCDVTIVAEGKKFPANRAVLAACSDYFKTMFTAQFVERNQPEIELKHPDCASADLLGLVLDFIYTGKLSLTHDNCFDVLAISCYLQMHRLTQICVKYISNAYKAGGSSFKSPLEILQMATNYNVGELTTLAYSYVAVEFVAMTKTNDFLQKLTFDQIYELLEREDLEVTTEHTVLDAVVRWVKHDWQSREQYVWPLLKKVRLGVISIEKVEEQFDGKLQEIPECKNICVELRDFEETKAVGPTLQSLPKIFTPRMKPKTFVALEGWTNAKFFCETTNKWKSITFPEHDRYSSPIVIGDMLYLVGGKENLSEFRRFFGNFRKYNHRSNPFERVGSALRNGRTKAATVCLNNKLYAIGGITTWRDKGEQTKSVECYDFNEKRWQSVADLPHSFKSVRMLSAVAYNDKIAVAGFVKKQSEDEEANASEEAAIVVYDPKEDEWTTMNLWSPWHELAKTGAVQLLVKDTILYSVVSKSMSYPNMTDKLFYFVTKLTDWGPNKFYCDSVDQSLVATAKAPVFCIERSVYVRVENYIHDTGITIPENQTFETDFSMWENVNYNSSRTEAVIVRMGRWTHDGC